MGFEFSISTRNIVFLHIKRPVKRAFNPICPGEGGGAHCAPLVTHLPPKKQGRVSKTSKGKVGGGEDSEAVAEVAEKLGSLRRGLEKKQGQLKEEAKKGPAGKTQKKS